MIEPALDVFTEIRYAGNQLRHTPTMLIAAAYRERRRRGSEDPPWTRSACRPAAGSLALPRTAKIESTGDTRSRPGVTAKDTAWYDSVAVV